MSKHTPGPWIYVRSERKIGVRDNSDTQSFGMVSAIAYIDEYDHEEFLHNASLIAAAPELIEALEAALEWIDAVPPDVALPAMPGFDRDWVNEILAEAKGESS